MLILTPNKRLAAFSIQQYNQQAVGKVWATPRILSLDNWLEELWKQHVGYIPVLSKVAQQLLFEQIIQNSDQGVDLLRITSTATSVIQAWTFLQQWKISLEKVGAYAEYSIDTGAFYTWMQRYIAWLSAHDYVDSLIVVDRILDNLQSVIPLISAKICLRGMQEIPPLYQKLFDKLSERGIEITNDQLIAPGATVFRSAFDNLENELQAAADWAIQQKENRIGIVIPELEANRKLVASIFGNKIPAAQLNISAPDNLSDFAMIDAALLILQIAQPIVDYADISMLLRSAYIASDKYDLNMRARLDRIFREHAESRFATGKIKNHSKHNAAYWTQAIQTLLQSWGWPGTDKFTEEEADLYSCWRDLLTSYNKLAVIIGEHTYDKAVQLLLRLATTTSFAAAETGLTKVHVLGMLEADGIPFDRLWVTGMTRESWPPEAKPNPFIPLELQRGFDLPRSSAQRELHVARRLTANFLQGGKYEVVFSYPRTVDEFACKVSTLIAHLPERSMQVATPAVKVNQLEYFEDNVAPAISDPYVSGGTSVIRLQAQCPFKANAEIRNRARPLVVPQLYLTPAVRGKIVHEILELYWKASGEQKLAVIIDQILTKWQNKMPNTLTDNYFKLEFKRLLGLIERWLAYENKREAFEILQLEQRRSISIGPINLNIQVDRIDRLADGSELVIDYKTGTVYPPDPQLDIYAMFVAPLAAYAYLKADQIEIKEFNPNLDTNILQLANDFAAGVASVNPASAQICEFCKLQALCRIYDN